MAQHPARIARGSRKPVLPPRRDCWEGPLVPGGAAPRPLLGVLALIIAIAVAVVPVVEARPKDRDTKQDEVATETVPAGGSGQSDVVYGDDAAAAAQQPLTVGNNSGSPNEQTLLDLDTDGDYIPDALDNCPSVQNPDQADADSDGNGDPCTVYQDTDGDTVPDKSDNCPNIATSDFSDRDGDGVGDSCDKSPDGIEPEPEPVPELNGHADTGETEPPPPENGENQDGTEIERPGRSRSKVRDRTETLEPVITTGVESANDAIGGQPAQDEPPTEEPVRDNPRRNEELIAEAAASGELDAPPEPPPAPQRAWDEEATADSTEWDSIVKIDAGAAADAESTAARPADDEPNDAGSGNDRQDNGSGDSLDRSAGDVSDSRFARGWIRAKLLLQGNLPDDESTQDVKANDGQADDAAAGDGSRDVSAPVPVENGLVISGREKDEDPPPAEDRNSQSGETVDEPVTSDEPEPLDEPPGSQAASQADESNDTDAGNPDAQPSRNDGGRRDGSSRAAAAAPERQRQPAPADEATQDVSNDEKPRSRRGKEGAAPAGWNSDRYFEGGSALDWGGSLEVAGTDDPDLYLTQRSGSGPGKRRGFAYAIPVDENGVYMVRLYFAEPYWGAPGGPEGDAGRRVFSVTAEGETLIEDLDIYDEVGELTALVKQAEVDVQDGELNLSFAASEGEPIVAAIEVLRPAP